MITTKRDGALISTETRTYDSGFQAALDSCGYGSFNSFCSTPVGPPLQISLGQVRDDTITDGSGRVVRDEQTQYVWQTPGGAGYFAGNFLHLPQSVSTYGPDVYGSNSYGTVGLSSQTTYGYDEANGSPQGLFGNQTSVHRWLNTGGTVTTGTAYDATGKPSVEYDAKGNPTTIGYDCNNTLPSAITNALGQTTTTLHDCNTGKPTSVQDPNDLVANRPGTVYTYDNAGIVRNIVYPDRGSTYFDYHSYAAPLHVTTSKAQDASTTLTTDTNYDGLGRVVSQTDPSQASIETTYDLYGNVASVSDPHFAASSPTDGTTSYTYDALGRMRRQCNPDNANNIPCQPGNSYKQWTYDGLTTYVTDEVGNTTIQTADSLGRVVGVVEPGSLYTSYTYDALGNLVNALQAGTGTDTPRQRSFVYDSLSRLLTSSNPETGIICYGQWAGSSCSGGYDANGNLTAKTDASGTVTSYVYDALNRLTSKTSSDGTIADSYYYDSFHDLWNVYHDCTYGIGRVCLADHSGIGGTAYDYDPMGRVKGTKYAVANSQPAYATGYQAVYDLAGNLTNLTYPDGTSIVNVPNTAGQLEQVKSGTTNVSYYNVTSFWPNGSPRNVTYGNGDSESFTLNSRLQSCSHRVYLPTYLGGTMISDKEYHYAAGATSSCGSDARNNGNIWQIADLTNPSEGSSNYTQTMTYDPLNRLSSWGVNSMGGQFRSQQFQYDAFGNVLSTGSNSGGGDPLAFSSSYDSGNHMSASQCNPLPGQSSNANWWNPRVSQAANYHYDGVGNLLCTGVEGANAEAFEWDASGMAYRLWAEHNNNTYGLKAWYLFNGDGQRELSMTYDGALNPATLSMRTYTYFNGQSYAEQYLDYTEASPTARWTDYVYANGRKVAKLENFDRWIHMSGSNSSNGNNRGSISYILYASSPINIGDKLMWRQYQTGSAAGGLYVTLTDGTGTSWSLLDSDGEQVNSDSRKNQWHNRVVDLSSYAGKTLGWATPVNDVGAGDGPWEIFWSDIALVHSDGSVVSLYNGGAAGPLPVATFFDGSMVHSLAAAVEAGSTLGSTAPETYTHYFIADQVGTSSMELASAGYPVWKGEFSPFGVELDASVTSNRYKFTGKERDQESGLDYFGARYYGSNMGRMMSPDPGIQSPLHLLNPQRWNMYSYGLNNPLSYTDLTGMDAAAVNFSKEIAIVGHQGVMSVHSDGTVVYARFGPAGGSSPTGPGLVQSFTLSSKVQFDSNGQPTSDSLNAVKKELSTSGPEKGQDPSSIRLNYFKTSPQETANLDAWIKQQQDASNAGKAPGYNVVTNNCTMFCQRGLVAGGAIDQNQANHASPAPNGFYRQLLELQSRQLCFTTSTDDGLGNRSQSGCQ